MTKPIPLIDDLFFDDQARERCASELAAYTAILDQQEHLQTTLGLLLARLQTIARELLAADYRETAALLNERRTINSSLLAIPWQISRAEYQRVIASLTLLHAQWQDNERIAAECRAQVTFGQQRIHPCRKKIRELEALQEQEHGITGNERMQFRKAGSEAANPDPEICYKRASGLAEAAKMRARIDYGCDLAAYSEWWDVARAAAQRSEQVVREALPLASSGTTRAATQP